MSSTPAADGTLVVVVCRAKHLPNRRKLDKQSPYVALRIGQAAEKTPAHFRAGQTPEWAFEVRFALTRERSPLMKVDVLDETKGIPTPIGSMEIDCSLVFAECNVRPDGKFILDSWYDLLFHGKRAGMIYLEMTFYPSAPIPPPRIPNSEDEYDNVYHSPPNKGHSSLLPALHMRLTSRDHSSRNHYDLADEFQVPARVSDRSPNRYPRQSPHSPSRSTGRLSDQYPLPPSPSRSTGRLSDQYPLPPSPSRSHDSSRKPFRDTDEREGSAHSHGWSKKLAYFTNAQPLLAAAMPSRESGHSPIRETFGRLKKKLAYKDTSPVFDGSFGDSEPVYPLRLDDTGPGARTDTSPPPPPTHSVNAREARRLPRRRAPSNGDEALARIDRLSLDPDSAGPLPFSADTIGLGDSGAHYPLPVLNRSLPAPNSDDLDPRYHAPTPSEFLSSRDRYRRGYGPSASEVRVDLNTDETGYLGGGKFSPSVFDRAVLREPHDAAKPQVPPKVPMGLTEAEYFVLEREKYLRDLAGDRY